jgi:predicted phosphodiesterase
MRTLVVGDVHGCSAELAALIAQARADRVVLVGDLFSKGPDALGVWRQIRDQGIEAVLGNHDARLIERKTKLGEALDAADPAWRTWTEALPLFVDAAGFTVVHASLHISGKLSKTTRHMALYQRRWPGARTSDPFWYDVYRGERRVIFGHDAMRGLIRRERKGKPWIIGLDTGCVYGGALTGYLVEEDFVLAVPAARPYFSPRS